MQKFKFKGWDESFKIVRGIMQEEDIQSAKTKLRSKNIQVIEIKKVVPLSEINIGRKTLKDEELASICGQIGIILNAGVSVVAGLEVIKQQNKKMEKILESILVGVKRGAGLGEAMEETGVFPSLLTDMVKSGELSGNIDEVLFNMENYYQREHFIKTKVKNASIYPMILLLATICMLLFFNFFIFNSLKDIFSGSDSLPGITIVVLGCMEFLNSNFIYVLIFTIVLMITFAYLKKRPKVRLYLDRISLKLPVVGVVKLHIITSRFTRSMGVFMKAAVPLLSALDSMELIIGNSFMAQGIKAAKGEIMVGSRVSDSLDMESLFEPVVIQMIRVGEETGKLEEMLQKLADIYDKKVESGITKLLALIDPIFTLTVGLFAAVIIIAVVLPILQMSNMVQ